MTAMAYHYHLTDHFKKQLKQYAKKYLHIIEDVEGALAGFDKRKAAPLGVKMYKVRVKSRDISRGKSHAFRLIVLVYEFKNLISPLVIYFKGDRGDIDKEDLFYHAAIVRKELRNLL